MSVENWAAVATQLMQSQHHATCAGERMCQPPFPAVPPDLYKWQANQFRGSPRKTADAATLVLLHLATQHPGRWKGSPVAVERPAI